MLEDNLNAVEILKGKITGKNGSKDPNIANDDLTMSLAHAVNCASMAEDPALAVALSIPEMERNKEDMVYLQHRTPGLF